jgi:hypothetical protein
VNRLFAKVEMRGEGVLREVHREIPHQHDDGRRRTAASKRFRNELREGDRNHEAGRDGDQRVQQLHAPPGPAGDGERAGHVRQR